MKRRSPRRVVLRLIKPKKMSQMIKAGTFLLIVDGFDNVSSELEKSKDDFPLYAMKTFLARSRPPRRSDPQFTELKASVEEEISQWWVHYSEHTHWKAGPLVSGSGDGGLSSIYEAAIPRRFVCV